MGCVFSVLLVAPDVVTVTVRMYGKRARPHCAWGIDLFFGIPAVGFRAITASKTSPWPLYFGIAANSTEHTQQAPPGWIQACIREQTVRHAS
ncbi:MAG TPA: hypothetical protein DEO97_15500 [Pseudomonas sp.]|nr:hypothetical protein [Pseudomonas sp.]